MALVLGRAPPAGEKSPGRLQRGLRERSKLYRTKKYPEARICIRITEAFMYKV